MCFFLKTYSSLCTTRHLGDALLCLLLCFCCVYFGICIFTGVLLFSLVPSPNCPLPFHPHDHRVPSLSIPTVKLSPVDTAFHFVLLSTKAPSSVFCCTRTGVILEPLVPSPNCPALFCPHDHRVPSSASPTV